MSMNCHLLLLFLAIGIFGPGSHGVSVLEGDPVTLHANVTKIKQEDVKYYFKNTLIAQLTGDLSFVCTDVKCNEDNERFRGRLKLDNETGSLTITNTRSTDSGDYHQQIIGSGTNREKNINVSVRNGVKEGKSATSDSGENNLNDSGLSSAAVAGICVAVVAIAAAFVYWIYCHMFQTGKYNIRMERSQQASGVLNSSYALNMTP